MAPTSSTSKNQKTFGFESVLPIQSNTLNSQTRPGSKKRKSTTAGINVKKSMLNMTTTIPKGALNALTPNQ